MGRLPLVDETTRTGDRATLLGAESVPAAVARNAEPGPADTRRADARRGDAQSPSARRTDAKLAVSGLSYEVASDGGALQQVRRLGEAVQA